MKKILVIWLSALIMTSIMSCVCSGAAIVVPGYDEVNVSSLIGKTNYNVSVYGDNLDSDLVSADPTLNYFYFSGNSVYVNGYVNNGNEDTKFNLQGTAYKTYDDNIVCNVNDTTGNYVVLFLCIEKKTDYNDYILFREPGNIQQLQSGEYGLKIYLQREGTREISLLEDVNVSISNVDNILSTIESTDYSSMNWFVSCFLPISTSDQTENLISPASLVTNNTFTYWDTEVYAIGSDRIYLGIQMIATNTTPPLSSQTTFSSLVEYYPIVSSTNPAYADPQRAADMFRVQNIGVTAMIGQGYYLQYASWNASGYTTPALNMSLNFGISLSYGPLGASLEASPSYYVPVYFGSSTILCGSTCSYPYSMPRRAQTMYTGLSFANTGDQAGLTVIANNIPEMSNKFDCYQTNWTFDIYKKNPWGIYSYLISDNLYCTSYFNLSI